MAIKPGNIIEKREFKSSSSNNLYTTILYDNCICCNCPAGGRKQPCKHIKKILFDNIENIKNINLDFYKTIQDVLEVENSTNLTQEEKRKIYANIILVNKEIADAAHNNKLSLEISTDYNSWAENKASKFINSINRELNKNKEYLEMGLIDKDTYTNNAKEILSTIDLVNNYKFQINEDL